MNEITNQCAVPLFTITIPHLGRMIELVLRFLINLFQFLFFTLNSRANMYLAFWLKEIINVHMNNRMNKCYHKCMQFIRRSLMTQLAVNHTQSVRPSVSCSVSSSVRQLVSQLVELYTWYSYIQWTYVVHITELKFIYIREYKEILGLRGCSNSIIIITINNI